MKVTECKFTICGLIGVFVSILFGTLVGVLFAFGFIPFIVTATWIVFGLGVLALIFLLIAVLAAAKNDEYVLDKCLHRSITYLLVGIIGDIITSIVALSIVLSTTLIPVITIVAIVAFFFALMISGLICFISCITNKI